MIANFYLLKKKCELNFQFHQSHIEQKLDLQGKLNFSCTSTDSKMEFVDFYIHRLLCGPYTCMEMMYLDTFYFVLIVLYYYIDTT